MGDVEVVRTSIKDLPKTSVASRSCDAVAGRNVTASCEEEVGVGRCFGEGDGGSKAGILA
jgi:hypothetical protein